MKKILTNYFDFTRTEQRGIVVLLIIILLLILSIILLPWFFREKNKPDYSGFLKEAREFMVDRDTSEDIQDEEDHYEEYLAQKIKPFPFDPNGLPAYKWKALGLEEWQIKIIKNFEKKGGRFREKGDLAKIYGISKEEFTLLELYIRIEEKGSTAYNGVQSPGKKELSPFDPNTLDSISAVKLGLEGRLIKNLLNFRAKGGKFYKKEDFAKLYGLSPDFYQALEPYIFITDTFPSKKSIKKNWVVVELNSADTMDLQQIKGIGPGFARKIVNYRNKLGGYIRKEQLLEVYGMDSVRYKNMLPQISIDVSGIRKINVNKITIKELIKHPYFEYHLAKSIIMYRDKKKVIKNLEELKQVEFMYDDIYAKVSPYLSL